MGSVTVAVSIIGALVTSLVVSLVGPTVNWNIERKRQLHEDRKARLDEWRRGVIDTLLLDVGDYALDLRSQLWFFSLRRHLSEDARKQLASWRWEYGESTVEVLHDELDRLAEEWGQP